MSESDRSELHHVFLIPGFFGFASLGDLPYFAHVESFLQETLAERGIQSRVCSLGTYPTSSLRTRTARLAEEMDERLAEAAGPIHLVGHSSGGLDARMLVSPGVSLETSLDTESLAARVKSVVTVATPHRGTPLASMFTGVMGQPILRLFSLSSMYAMRFGRIPMGVLSKLVWVFTRLDDVAGLNSTVLDQLYEQLLGDFNEERRGEIRDFFRDVGKDQSLLVQLTPQGMDVFSASVVGRPGVRYGSVLTWGKEPGLGSTWAAKLDPYAHSTHLIYSALHSGARRMPRLHAVPLTPEERVKVLIGFKALPDWKASDGIVPTLSQVFGDVIGGVRADHHDVIGHFEDRHHRPAHYDWLASGSGFKRPDFDLVWTKIADYIAQ